MAELPLDEAVARFQGNEERINKFVNAPGGEESFETSGGESVPVLPKMLEAVTTQAEQAKTARDDIVLDSKIVEDVAAGLAATVDAGTENRYFRVFGTDENVSVIYYRHDPGSVATEITRVSSETLVRKNVDDVNGILKSYTAFRTDVIKVREKGLSEWGEPESFNSWAVGVDAVDVEINYIDFDLRYVNLNSAITLSIYSRDPADNLGPASINGNDVFLYSRDYAASDFLDTSEFQVCRFDFPFIKVPAGRRLVFAISGDTQLLAGRFIGTTEADTQWSRGYFKQGAQWGGIPVPNAVSFAVGYKYASLPDFTLKSEFEPVALEAKAVIELTEPKEQLYYQRIATASWSGSANFQRWSFGKLIAAGERIAALGVTCDYVSANDSIELKVYFRPASSTATGAAGTSASDQLFDSVVFPVTDFENTMAAQDLRLPHKTFVATDSGYLLYTLKAVGGQAVIGLARGAEAAATQPEKGFFSFSTSPTIWGAIGAAPAAASFSLFKEVRLIKPSALPELEVQQVAGVALQEAYNLTAQTQGTTIELAGSLNRDGSALNILTSVQLSSQPVETATKAVSLLYSTTGTWVFNANAWLGHRNVSNPVVTRLSDSQVLVRGADYQLNANGRLQGLVNTAPQDCSVTYDYSLIRYDLLQIDSETLQVSVVQGGARDADVLEVLPSNDPGKVPLYLARVVGAVITDLLPLWQFEDVRRNGAEADWQRLRVRNAAALRKVMGKISRGAPVTLAAYGDSITALQHGYPGYAANGPNRDLATGYLKFYPAEVVSALPKFDFGDGAGQVHIKMGFNWRLVEAIEQISGSPVEYLNFGIGGTASGNTADNGLWPARLAEVTNAAPDLVTLAFGMNELGSSATYSNIVSIIQQLQSVGCEVAVISVPRINSNEYNNLPAWRRTNRALERAAIDTGSAFVPFHWIADDRNIAALHAAIPDTCAANLYNHPGIEELQRYGRLLVESLL